MDILTEVTAPLSSMSLDRFSLGGPTVHLKPQMALTMSTVLHELCTNACKYGALSNDAGEVNIDWSIEGAGLERELHLDWRESGDRELHQSESGASAQGLSKGRSAESTEDE